MNQYLPLIVVLIFVFAVIYFQLFRAEKLLNEFSPLLTNVNLSKQFLLQRVILEGIYNNREIHFDYYLRLGFFIKSKVNIQSPKKIPWYKKSQEITKGYRLSGSYVRFSSKYGFASSTIKLPQSPKQILDGLIEACSKAEQADFKIS